MNFSNFYDFSGIVAFWFGSISAGFWLGLIWIWLASGLVRFGFGLDFALSLTFTQIFCYSGLS